MGAQIPRTVWSTPSSMILCVYIAAERAVSGKAPDMIGLRRCSTYMWL